MQILITIAIALCREFLHELAEHLTKNLADKRDKMRKRRGSKNG